MAYDFKNLSVLVVEDTVPMLRLVCAMLQAFGTGRILHAQDGKAGFELFCEHNPDIVITDWHMPGASGIEMVRNIRVHPDSPNKTVPILMVTGFAALSRVARARDTGATEFLSKPFSANDLAQRIDHIINKPRDFIRAAAFFGPDRRRRVANNYEGPLQRSEDHGGTTEIVYLG